MWTVDWSIREKVWHAFSSLDYAVDVCWFEFLHDCTVKVQDEAAPLHLNHAEFLSCVRNTSEQMCKMVSLSLILNTQFIAVLCDRHLQQFIPEGC